MRARHLALACALLLAPALAHAGGADNKAAAQTLFEEGRQLMDKGDFAAACPKLESSQKLDPGAGTLLNLAACYEHNGQTASAWVTYTDAATASQDRHPDWAEKARAKAKELEPTLSRLTVVVKDPVDGLQIKRDGAVLEAGSYNVAIPVDPGRHVIDAGAPGRESFHTDVNVTAGGAKESVTIPALAEVPGEQASPGGAARGSSGTGQRIAGAAIAGAGLVGLVVGGVFGAVAIDKKNQASDPSLCLPDFSRCNTAGKALVDDAMTAGTISTVAIIAGAALVAGGAVVFFLAPKAHTREAASLNVRPGSAGGPLGVTLGGAF